MPTRDDMKNRFVIENIHHFVRRYAENQDTRTRWGEPLVAFAHANDPMFLKLKKAVRSSHALPRDLLDTARSVIVYFLPFEKSVAKSNRKAFHASRQWAVAYVETNRLIIDLNRYLSKVLSEKGFETVNLPPTHNFDTEQLMSDWSHKHVAHIAGLGGFGSHHMLITVKGCCGRFGSIITDAELSPSPRMKTQFCLHRYNGTCQTCIKRCVTGALTPDRLDRRKCYALLLENAEIYSDEGMADVCGKCASGVPCSFLNPVERAMKRNDPLQKGR